MKTIMFGRAALTLVVVGGVVACGGESGSVGSGEAAPAASEAAPAADAGGYSVMDVTDGGTIRGTVRLAGAAPAVRTVQVTDDVAACGRSQQVRSVMVGAGGGVADAVASLTNITRGAAPDAPASPPALDQQGCRFVPPALLVQAGAPVHILNSDPITHNVHTVSFENRPINRAQPAAVRQIEVSFRSPDKVRVKCDIHEWMSAWVVVIDHPYHALTDDNGAFEITNVPPGTYTFEAWHGSTGTVTREVTVTAGGVSTVDVELPLVEGAP